MKFHFSQIPPLNSVKFHFDIFSMKILCFCWFSFPLKPEFFFWKHLFKLSWNVNPLISIWTLFFVFFDPNNKYCLQIVRAIEIFLFSLINNVWWQTEKTILTTLVNQNYILILHCLTCGFKVKIFQFLLIKSGNILV